VVENSGEMLGTLETEAENLRTLELDRMPVNELVQEMHAADREALAAVQTQLAAVALGVERVAQRLAAGGRLFYLGAGTSGRLGVLDAAECPPTYNSPREMVQGLIAGGDRALRFAVEGAEDDAEQGRQDLAACRFCTSDTLVGITASGRTPYVLGGMAYAREQGAWMIGLSCVPSSPVALAADLAITPVTGAEVVVGSTRMKAGTATKLVLNMLSTGAMVRMGYVYGNLMVNVQPTNGKLLDRARRIVERLTGLQSDEANLLLQEAGSVRVAVIMQRLQIGRQAAEGRLRLAGGRMRDVVG